MKPEFSIVVPAFNEEGRVGQTLRSIFRHVRNTARRTEVIVVDDGSSDSTMSEAQNAFAEFPEIDSRVIRYGENRGKGYAVKTGLAEARAPIALFSDADLSTPIEEFEKLVSPILSGACDVAFGSRALDRKLIGTRQPWRREQSGKVFNLAVRVLTGLPFWDTQCGFKAFNMRVFRPLLPMMQIERFGFDVEFLYVANYRGLRLKEIPVRWNHCEGSKISVFRDSQRMFREILRVRGNSRSGVYDAINTTNPIAEISSEAAAATGAVAAGRSQNFPAVEMGN
jgi:glycosyltransferase involved in cell wall biosynthesis